MRGNTFAGGPRCEPFENHSDDTNEARRLVFEPHDGAISSSPRSWIGRPIDVSGRERTAGAKPSVCAALPPPTLSLEHDFRAGPALTATVGGLVQEGRSAHWFRPWRQRSRRGPGQPPVRRGSSRPSEPGRFGRR